MTEGNILSEAAMRFRNIATAVINNQVSNLKGSHDEIMRVSQLPYVLEIANKDPKELSQDEIKFAKMLHFAKLAHKDPSAAKEFAEKEKLYE